MYSRSSEPVRFERDCPAVLVPQGEKVTLPAGSVGYITQALGGSYTVFVEGNLMRIAGSDGDAIGKDPPPPIVLPEGASDEDVEVAPGVTFPAWTFPPWAFPPWAFTTSGRIGDPGMTGTSANMTSTLLGSNRSAVV